MKIKIAILSFVLVALFSCQKEPTDNIVITKPLSEDSTYLSQYIVIDTTISTRDTLSKMEFYYDAAKRNIGIDYIDYDNTGLPTTLYKSKFYYTGTDTFPSKKRIDSYVLLNSTNNPSSNLKQTTFFTYKEGQLFSDSTIVDGSTSPGASMVISEVKKYTYYNDSVVTSYFSYNVDPRSNAKASYTTYWKKINGNITQQRDSSNLVKQDFSFFYDTHPNPFYRTLSKFALYNDYPTYVMETYAEAIFATNNALDINQTYNDPQINNYNFHFKNTYQYKANGYPSAVWYNDQNDPKSSFKGVYLYTN